MRVLLRVALLSASAALLAGTSVPAAGQTTHVLVVTGLGGSPEYTRRFAEWGGALADAAGAAGVADTRVVWLAEEAVRDDRVDGPARKQRLGAELARIAGDAGADDVVVIAFFGHGSDRGGEARLNLPGPDLEAGELAVMLEPIRAGRLVVINAASASGGFVAPLSAENRVVITATRSAREAEATRFGGHFVEALSGAGADTDKDGAVSMLEAFEFARIEVAREYAAANQLASEHALLDDDGDGRGTLEPGDGSAGDGALAATVVLGRAGRARAGAAAPASAAGAPAAGAPADSLLAEKARLEAALAALRAREASMDPAAYEAELERLLVAIARNGRAIRERGGGGG